MDGENVPRHGAASDFILVSMELFRQTVAGGTPLAIFIHTRTNVLVIFKICAIIGKTSYDLPAALACI